MSEQARSYPKLQSEFATDPEMMELVDMFVAEIPERIKSLQDCWNNARYDDLKRLSHQLKGASGGYGFSIIGKAAGSLEATLKTVSGAPDTTTLETIKQQFNELETLCRRAAA